MQNFVVGRFKLQLCVYLSVVVIFVFLFIYPRTEVYNYYQQLSKISGSSDDGTVSAKPNSLPSSNNYNLMDENVGFSKIRQFFNGYNSAECTLGD